MANWKPEYDENRRRKIRENPEFAAKIRASQERAKAKRNAAKPNYLKDYYLNNKSKWTASRRKNQPEINARKRELYASDPIVREQCKAAAKRWCSENPEKRKAQHLRKYRLTVAEHAEMLAAQNGGCAICGRHQSPDKVKLARSSSGKRDLAVDHCHTTGVVRGLLCSTCNFGIGSFRDDPALLDAAASYLRRTSETISNKIVRQIGAQRPRLIGPRPIGTQTSIFDSLFEDVAS